MNAKEKAMVKASEEFFKEALCVDGEVKLLPKIEGFKIMGVIEFNDSKRGKFYMGRLERTE